MPGDGGGGTVTPGNGPLVTVGSFSTYRGDAKAAYTLFHDDLCNPDVDKQIDVADPELTERGLVASFGAIASYCDERDLWDELDVMRSHGHEIVNHSMSHVDLTEMSVDLTLEIDDARSLLEQNLTGTEITFFIFPFDSFDDGTIQHLKDAGYLGARTGGRGLNDADFADDFDLWFDVYGPGYSIYAEAENTPCADVAEVTDWTETSAECRAFVLSEYLSETIETGGWGIRELHSVDGEAWEPVDLDLYEAHLDDLARASERGDVWVATASDVVRYRRARDACSPPSAEQGLLTFAAPNADCTRYRTELSLRVTSSEAAPAGASLRATQAGGTVTVTEELAGQWLLDVDPAAGPVTLDWVTP